MEPFTITATCLGVVNHIFTLSNKIKDFVIVVREARSDMLGLASELSTLSLSLSMLQDDCTKIPFPESVMGDLSSNLEDVLKKCDDTTKEMIRFLDNYKSKQFLSGFRWAVNGRDEMNRLKQKLESSKPTIGLTLMVGQVILLKSIKEETTIIKDQTAAIKNDTAMIPSVKNDTTTIIKLLSDKLNLSDQQGGKQFVMQRFYDEMTIGVESVVDEMDSVLWTPEMKAKEELVEKEGDDRIGIPTISLTTMPEVDPEPEIMDNTVIRTLLEVEATNTKSYVFQQQVEIAENGVESLENDSNSTVGNHEILAEPFEGRLSLGMPPQLPQLSLENLEPLAPLHGLGNFWNSSSRTTMTNTPGQQLCAPKSLEETGPRENGPHECFGDDGMVITSAEEEVSQEIFDRGSEIREGIPHHPPNISNTFTIDNDGTWSSVASRTNVIPGKIQSEKNQPEPDSPTQSTNQVSKAAIGTFDLIKTPITNVQCLRVHLLSKKPTAQLPPCCIELLNLYLSHKRKDSSVPLHDCSRTLSQNNFESSETDIRQAAQCGGLDLVHVFFELGESEVFITYSGLAVYCSTHPRNIVDIVLDNTYRGNYETLQALNSQKLLVLFNNECQLTRMVEKGLTTTACLIFEGGVQNSQILANPLLRPLELKDRVNAKRLLRSLLNFKFTQIQQDEAVCTAVQVGDCNLLDALLSRFKNTNAKNEDGHVLCSQAAKEGLTDLLKVILKHKPTKSTTALRLACGAGHLEIVRLLLDYGVNVNGSTESGSTGLHFACDGFYLDIVRLLLSRGANTSLKDRDGTPLKAAQKRLKGFEKGSSLVGAFLAGSCKELIKLLKDPTNVKKGIFW